MIGWLSGWPTTLWHTVLDRSRPGPHGGAIDPLAYPRLTLWLPLALGVVLTVLPPTWRVLRMGVTWVHELGHAGVGVALGRRFTGFVVRSDMSGHAVTVGRPRGPALVLTTWAGYPAPALVGAAAVWLALAGWAPLVLGAVALLAVVCLPFVRSWTTAAVTLLLALAFGALWWWRSDDRAGAVLLTVAVVLLLGAWRHWASVAGAGSGSGAGGSRAGSRSGRTGGARRWVDRDSDPATLARLTGWPRWFWVGTHLVVIAAATAGAAYWVYLAR